MNENFCYLTINCDTGQYLQFLRCFKYKLVCFTLSEKTYRSWWVERETVPCATSVCWIGGWRGGGEIEAFRFLPRPRPTYHFFLIFEYSKKIEDCLTPASCKLAFPLPTPKDTLSIGLKDSYRLRSCFPGCDISFSAYFRSLV